MGGRSHGGRGAVLALLLLTPGCRVPDGETATFLTRAEVTNFAETTRYAEVVGLMEGVAAESPLIHLTSFGYTVEGRPLPLAVVGEVADGSPEAVRRSGRLRVYLQGNIHGGEVCGKEALLMLLRELARGEHGEWSDSMVLLVAPVYNADGNERIRLTNRPRQDGPMGGMGQRANAQGLDLNRDHMKLDSPEARSFVGLLNDYDPHVTVDLHTTDGTRHGYHLTYSPPLHPNTAPELLELLRGRWLPEVTRRIREAYGWDYYYYGNAYPPEPGAEPAWITFDHRPRFNNNYVGLRNRVAILSEAYSYASFRDRVVASLRFVEEILSFAHGHAGAIQGLVERIDRRSLAGDSLAVRATWERSPEPVEILLGRVEDGTNPFSGERVLRRLAVQDTVSMYEYGTFRPTERALVPAAYLIPPGTEGMAEVLERVRAHGIRTDVLSDERTLEVQVFRVDSIRVAERPFQGRVERTVWGRYRNEERTLPRGTTLIPMDQPLARLAFYLLEPRSDDGFLNWGFMDAVVAPGLDSPVFRTLSRPPEG